MRKKKQIISFLLTGILSLMMICSTTSCTDDSSHTDGNTETEVMYDPKKGIDFEGEKQYISQEYKIVIPNEEDKSLQYASKELQTFIASASGNILPIVKESLASTADKIISIGDTTQAAFLTVNEKDLNTDGFRIVTRGDDIFIKGAHTTATMYGVYDFAEKVIGVKFLSGDYTYVPTGNSLCFYPMDITEIPTFQTRHYFSGTLFRDLYNAVHMRLVSVTADGITSDETGYAWLDRWYPKNFHSSFQLVPPAKYQSLHPDWYGGGQLCLTNGINEKGEIEKGGEETMAQAALENLKLWILENPTVTNFMVSENDGGGLCSCSNCTASYKVNGGYSGTKLVFINALAKEIEEWAAEVCPEREIFIYTFAYSSSAIPPFDKDGKPVNDLVVPRHNVGVMLAKASCEYHELGDPHCEKTTMEEKAINEWSSFAVNFAMYDYQVNFNVFMFYLPHTAHSKSQLLKYEKIGVQTVMSTAAPWIADYYQGLLDTYLYSKLMWNPHRNITELIEEFNYYYYTEKYAEVANDFVYTLDNNYAVLDATVEGGFHTDRGYNSGRTEWFKAKYYPIGMLKRLEDNTAKAMEDVSARVDLLEGEKETLNMRLKKLIIQPQFMILWNYSDYYDNGSKEYAQKFFENTDSLGITHYGEHNHMTELKELYGIV